MRKSILLALCLTALWGSVQAQNKKAANAIFAKILFVDYGNPNSIDNLDITNGIEIGYIRNINRWLNFSLPAKVGLANVVDDANNNRIFTSLDGILQFQIARTEDTRIIPYLMGGGGSSGGSAGGGGSYGGGSASSSGGSMSSNFAMNPYLQQMGDMMAGTMTNNWQRQVQPQIASQAIAAGGYGGSRQGVAEANSANDLNMGIGSALANLYGNGYGQGLNYDLGQQNLGLGYANLDRNINNDNLNWQMQGANFGLGIYDRMQQANQLGLQTGSQIQNTPLNYWNQFSQGANSIGQGYGTSTQSGGGNPLMGAIGGAQLGSQVANWWNSQNAPSYPGNNGFQTDYNANPFAANGI